MKTALVVTSISAPNPALQALAKGALQNGLEFSVIGDTKSPKDFQLDGCTFYDIEKQLERGGQLAQLCPTKHYARKNIGYLIAIKQGAQLIVETDDDNLPYDSFWAPRTRVQPVQALENTGWVNVYSGFSDLTIWPRGLPLDAVQCSVPAARALPVREMDCPIQQGLANGDPDVDAIYRLILPLPIMFRADRRIGLGVNAWCPFNSQNTAWWEDAFPLLYLPAYCSFRMTDIWRSFVAQRIAWANGWGVLFHEATVWQDRNEHNLMRDFSDEVSGYLHNRLIGETLQGLDLRAGRESMGANLLACYEALVRIAVIDQRELPLLEAWTSSLAGLQRSSAPIGPG